MPDLKNTPQNPVTRIIADIIITH